MESQGLTLKSALTVSGLGLLAWYIFFMKKGSASEARNVQKMGVAQPPKPPPSVLTSMGSSSERPKIVPIPSGKSFKLTKDIRALVAPQAMRMSGVESSKVAVAPFMTAQPGAGAVRIFNPGEEVICNDLDLADGCFYAAETETDSDGGTFIVGFKRFTAGSPATLQASLDGKPFAPDFDPYTGQTFSDRGEALKASLMSRASEQPKQAVSGSLGEDFRDEPAQGHRFVNIGPRKMPPSIERRIRAR